MNNDAKGRPWLLAFMSRNYMTGLLAVSLILYMLTYLEGTYSGNPIRSDGAGYYAYLPSYVLYADPSFETDARIRYGGEFPLWTYVRRYEPTGRYLVTYNIGVALLTTPFFLSAHLATWLMRAPPGAPESFAFQFPLDGYSLLYQHAAGLAGLFYFLAAAYFLKRSLDDYFGRAASLFALTGMVFGTNLLYFGTGFTVNSHPGTFFLLALLLWLTPRWYRHPESRGLSLGLGMTLGLLYLVRPVNAVFFLVVPLWGMTRWRDVVERFALAWKNIRSISIMTAALLACLIPQLVVWWYATGSIIVNSYQDVGGLVAPELSGYFVGIQRGVFFWFPIAAMAVLGFIPLYRDQRWLFWPLWLAFVAHSLVSCSYENWRAAGAFGGRYFVDATILLAFPLASLYRAGRQPWPRRLLIVGAVLCLGWTLFQLKLFYTTEVFIDGLDPDALFDIFWWRKEALRQWWWPGG